ncbi:unnamed protein product, partial [Brenthis ino]
MVLVQPAERLYNKNTNWEMYKGIITKGIELINPLKTVEDIEEAIENLNKILHEAATSSTKVKEKLPLNNKYPKMIKDKILECRHQSMARN